MKKITAIIMAIIIGVSAFSVAAYAKTPEEMIKQPASIVTAFKNFFNILLPSNSNYPTGISVTQNNTNKNVPKGSYLTNGGSTLTVKVTSKKGQNVLANQKYSYDMYKLDNKGNITGSAVLNGSSSSSTGLNSKLTKYTNVGNYALILKTENGGYMTSYKLNIIDKLDTKPTNPVNPTRPEPTTKPSPTDPGNGNINFHNYEFVLYVAPNVSLAQYGKTTIDMGNTVIQPYATRNIFEYKQYQSMATTVHPAADTVSTKAPVAPQIEGYTFLGWSPSQDNNPMNGPFKLIKANEELPYANTNGYSYSIVYYSVYVNNKTHVAYAQYNFVEGNGESLLNYQRDENGENILSPLGFPLFNVNDENIGNEKLTDKWLLNWLGYIPE